MDLCRFLFQKSSHSLGDGPHDIGLPGCLFYRIPHKVCAPLKKATAAQLVKSLQLKTAVARSIKLTAQNCCGSVSKVGRSKLLWLSQ